MERSCRLKYKDYFFGWPLWTLKVSQNYHKWINWTFTWLWCSCCWGQYGFAKNDEGAHRSLLVFKNSLFHNSYKSRFSPTKQILIDSWVTKKIASPQNVKQVPHIDKIKHFIKRKNKYNLVITKNRQLNAIKQHVPNFPNFKRIKNRFSHIN